MHAHNGTAAVYAALAKYAAWPHRLRVIATIHAFPSEKALTRQLMRGALARCDLVVAVSYELSERLRRNKWLASCITITEDMKNPTPHDLTISV